MKITNNINKPYENAPEHFKKYFDAIKECDADDSTEHTLRTALQNLLAEITVTEKKSIKIIHEPKKDKTGKGAPDFKFKINDAILGYLENKKIGEKLDATLKSAQITKYKQLSGNIIVTNYLEWILLKDGEVLLREVLCSQGDIGNRKARLDPDKVQKVATLISKFYSTPPKAIGRAKDLALALATRCHDLRDVLHDELLQMGKENGKGKLWGLYDFFKQEVLHELTVKDFSDAFAQTLGYGLFLARLNMASPAASNLQLNNAEQFIPDSFALIRELVDFLKELEKEEYLLARQPVDEILSIMNSLDLSAIQEDLAFTKMQGRLFEPMEEERLLFAKDPYVYFYEDFLKAYEPEMRKGRGVYYTPPPVVNFIIRAINDILKNTFGMEKGLADHKKVTVLDFATGTGTFLIEILQQICESTSDSVFDQVVREHVLKNLYGFEYMIAPYTIAHLKLSQFLRDKGYVMQPKERLQIYLTNTLEKINPQGNWLLPALSHEVKLAQEVKDKKILVITGNPPYSVKSKNTSDWITGLLKDAYFHVDGKPLGERNSKNLLDDYVKFIRFAQWKMDEVDEGVVGIITNHSFLDNPTFCGMRHSLMRTFNQIYVLDLHGNTKRKEISPDGSKEENVFDIEQGVSISFFIKKKELERVIRRVDLWGTRKSKYNSLLCSSLSSLGWETLKPDTPHYLFSSQNKKLRSVYEEGWRVSDIFNQQSSGVKTHRDHFVIDFDEDALKERIKVFRDLTIPDAEIAKKYCLRNNRDWVLAEKRKAISIDEEYKSAFTRLLYRPFDTLAYFHHDDAVDRPRNITMRHMLDNDNIGLVAVRQVTAGEFNHATVSQQPIEMKTCSHDRGTYLFPLYLYNLPNDKKQNAPKFSVLEEANQFDGMERLENLVPEFRTFIDKKYNRHYTPEQIFGYIYAILHSPTYRSKYLEFLKIDFPRIPFVDDALTFEELSMLGWELVQAHLFKSVLATPKVDINRGDMHVEKTVYAAETKRLYINKEQYFSPVPQDVWEFHIGGYQVLDKYLKSRKNRTLTLDEIENVQNIVKVLAFTIVQMQKIEKINF